MMPVFRRRRLWFDDLRTSEQEWFLRSFLGRAQNDHAAVMIPDESPPPRPETEAPRPLLKSANDNGGTAATPIDPRILIIARAIGRQIAREQLDSVHAANDNMPEDER